MDSKRILKIVSRRRWRRRRVSRYDGFEWSDLAGYLILVLLLTLPLWASLCFRLLG